MPPLELKFLTEDVRLIELARLYWELDQEEKAVPHQLKALAPRFALPANKILKTVLETCEASSPAILCETCGRARRYDSRSDYLEAQRHYRRYGSWQCWECYSEEERRRRDEEEKRRELAARQALALRLHHKELVEKAYARQEGRDYLLPTELSLTSAVYLLSAMKAGGPVCPSTFWEGLTTSKEPDIFAPRIIKDISPTKTFDEEILDRLKARGLVAVSAASEPEAFDFHEDMIVGYDSGKVQWHLLPDVPADERPSYIRQVEERLNRREHKTWHDEWPQLWKKIAAAECVQFLVCSLDKFGITYAPDEQATDLFGSLVETYSLAQMFMQIDYATKRFADFARRQRWPMRAGRALEQVRSNVEYYRSKGREIYAYSYRPAHPARSVISNIFFSTALGVGGDYFFKAPKDIELPELDAKEGA